ncbi:hypothetical protein G7Y79_00013g033820 [Physcia stellaris]|nr:hypothetical protein G7Y79_00013g033820 [Physcia stellaris]
MLFTEDNNWDAWSKLVRLPSHAPEAMVLRRVVGRKAQLSRIESLPAEVISLILQNPFLRRRDLAAFGLASDLLWMHVLRLARHECRHLTGCWAGMEVANVGTSFTALPAGFEDILRRSVGLVETGDIASPTRYPFPARYLTDAAWHEYDVFDAASWKSWIAALTAHNGDGCDLGRAQEEMLLYISAIAPGLAQKTWALRNLTTREYVRCQFDVKTQRGLLESTRMKVSMEDVLIMRVSQTSCFPRPISLLQGAKDVLRGAWVGHRFDIVLLQDETSQRGMKNWKDVTSAIENQAIGLLEALEQCTLSSEADRDRHRLVEEEADRRRSLVGLFA